MTDLDFFRQKKTDANMTEGATDLLVNGTFYYDSSDNFENYLSAQELVTYSENWLFLPSQL